jgi:acyl carrier protein phosphodiesterase
MPYDQQNWLLSYQTIEGINNILTMDGQTKNKSKTLCYRGTQELYTEFEEDFTDFFDDLRAHAKQN